MCGAYGSKRWPLTPSNRPLNQPLTPSNQSPVWFQTLGADEFDALVRAIGALPTEPARLSLWSWTLNFCTCTCAAVSGRRRAEPQRHCGFPPAGLNGHARGRCEQLCAVLDLLSNALLLSQAVARSMFRATVPASDVLEVRRSFAQRVPCNTSPARWSQRAALAVRTGHGWCCVASMPRRCTGTHAGRRCAISCMASAVRAGARREARL